MKLERQATRPPARNAGYAVSGILLVLLLASTAYGTYRLLSFRPGDADRRALLLARLALARDTVIAYAATDERRPGRLLCPDLVGNGISPLLTGNDCPGHNGWLPWKTLDLPGDGDDHGQTIRYVISPGFGGDHSTPPLNSETVTSLSLDAPPGQTSHGIAALLIAPRGPLDSRNADGDALYFTGGSAQPGDNDMVMAITREQLMAATEQRIANQLRRCLEVHVASQQNPEQTYPWPAPLGKTLFQGNSGSLFGRLPDTQPGSPLAALQAGIGQLATSQARLGESGENRLLTLATLQQQAGFLRGLFDRLYEIAVRLDALARQADASFAQLDARLASAAGSPESLRAVETARDSLAALITGLEDSGFDFFELELAILNGKLKTDIDKASAAPGSTTLGNVLTSINNLKSPLLSDAQTPNSDLQQQLEANRQLAAAAAQAVSEAKSKLTQAAAALLSAQGLVEANQQLGSDIRSLRLDLDPGELRYRARRILALASSAGEGADNSSAKNLGGMLRASDLMLRQALPSAAPVQQAASAIAAALAAADANAPETTAAANTAASRLVQLADWLEAAGDNLALETLKQVSSALRAAAGKPALLASESTGLRATLAMAAYWSQVATRQTGEIARLARKSITAKNDSDTSAYTAARRLLDTLDGSSGSIALYDKLGAAPTSTNRDNAERALALSQTRLTELIDAARRLAGSLASSHAQATVPTAWFGKECNFLNAGNAGTSWWFTEGWKNLFFYQINDRLRADSGTLTVNGQGRHALIVIGAGAPLPGRQDRSQPAVAHFLESRNAHGSRDGMALEPGRDFSRGPLAPDFNDQLAY